MLSFRQLRQYIEKKLPFSAKEKQPAAAYDLWCETYDRQPDNLVLALEEIVFTGLLNEIILANATIADIGCGTGRHWKKILELEPAKLTGFDVSLGMLSALKQKYPAAETYLLKNSFLQPLKNESCDTVISTLALAHIENMGEALTEWSRVLKKGGDLVITDYHPAALMEGGDRTFRHNNKLIAVKNYVHTIEKVRAFAKSIGFTEVKFIERIIDDTVKHYYEKQNAIVVFNKFRNMPVIYGVHFKKAG